MAILPDAISRGVGSGTSLTQAHTSTGSNLILWTSILAFKTGDNVDHLTGITHNGSAMTQVGTKINQVTGVNTYLFYILAPTTGAQNIIASFNATMDEIDLRSSSYTGAKQSGVPDAVVNNGPIASQTSFTQTLTTVADNCWLVGSWRSSNGVFTYGTNTFGRVDNSHVDAMVLVDSNSDQTPAGSKSMTATCSSGTVGGTMASFAPLVTNYVMPVTVGSFTLTGVIVGLSIGYRMAVSVGNFVLTGVNVLLKFSGWSNMSKSSSTFTNKAKNSSSWTDQTKNSSNWTDQTKS